MTNKTTNQLDINISNYLRSFANLSYKELYLKWIEFIINDLFTKLANH